ncbi:hypothetical protein HN51_024924 [Arachis hypogaea]|uniref:Wound-induced protein 1 n=2 Tax=Arachis TaxID=3817 RepID=A0A445C762_ARAHY|nr:wound-induced protein 1-like [Arachis duranensis]XP_025611392.1 wound-induced protein 1-like [Arachis hypogaea]RYR46770.1 hypothetical protein Ahy_A07g032585 [Arachis hypogaea]
MVVPEIIEEKDRNKRIIRDLYKAIISKDADTLHLLLAPNLEWWFHGPQRHRHHLIPFLTCSFSSASSSNPFVPHLIEEFGSTVIIAEGYDKVNNVWWVHAWTITVDGVITQIREYLNTSVIVTKLRKHLDADDDDACYSSMGHCVWKSKLIDDSVPGLILAI